MLRAPFTVCTNERITRNVDGNDIKNIQLILYEFWSERLILLSLVHGFLMSKKLIGSCMCSLASLSFIAC